MEHDANVSSNAPAEQVQFFLHNAFCHNTSRKVAIFFFIFLFRNTFDNSWVNVYWD